MVYQSGGQQCDAVAETAFESKEEEKKSALSE